MPEPGVRPAVGRAGTGASPGSAVTRRRLAAGSASAAGLGDWPRRDPCRLSDWPRPMPFGSSLAGGRRGAAAVGRACPRGARAPTRPAAPRRRAGRRRRASSSAGRHRPGPSGRRPPRRRSPGSAARRRGSRRRCPGSGSRPRPGRSWCRGSRSTGMPSLRASLTAMCSFLVSTIQTALGTRPMSRMPPSVLSSLSFSRAQLEQLLLGHAGAGHVVEVDLLELLEPLQPLVHGGEVGEHAAQPALVDVRHADAGGLLGDRLLGLLLGARRTGSSRRARRSP